MLATSPHTRHGHPIGGQDKGATLKRLPNVRAPRQAPQQLDPSRSSSPSVQERRKAQAAVWHRLGLKCWVPDEEDLAWLRGRVYTKRGKFELVPQLPDAQDSFGWGAQGEVAESWPPTPAGDAQNPDWEVCTPRSDGPQPRWENHYSQRMSEQQETVYMQPGPANDNVYLQPMPAHQTLYTPGPAIERVCVQPVPTHQMVYVQPMPANHRFYMPQAAPVGAVYAPPSPPPAPHAMYTQPATAGEATYPSAAPPQDAMYRPPSPAQVLRLAEVLPKPAASAPAPQTPPPAADLKEAPADAKSPGPRELPSRGSALHGSGDCKPCAFVFKEGCKNGTECKFCHLCDQGERKRRKKERRAIKRSSSGGCSS